MKQLCTWDSRKEASLKNIVLQASEHLVKPSSFYVRDFIRTKRIWQSIIVTYLLAVPDNWLKAIFYFDWNSQTIRKGNNNVHWFFFWGGGTHSWTKLPPDSSFEMENTSSLVQSLHPFCFHVFLLLLYSSTVTHCGSNDHWSWMCKYMYFVKQCWIKSLVESSSTC